MNIKELIAAYSEYTPDETARLNTAELVRALRRSMANLWAASQPDWHPADGLNRDRGSCWHCWNFVIRSGNSTVAKMLHRIKDASTEAWPEYSGDIVYPVPAPEGYLPANESANASASLRAEHCYEHSPDCWVGEYGDTRRRLCAFQAEYLNKLLVELQDGQD